MSSQFVGRCFPVNDLKTKQGLATICEKHNTWYEFGEDSLDEKVGAELTVGMMVPTVLMSLALRLSTRAAAGDDRSRRSCVVSRRASAPRLTSATARGIPSQLRFGQPRDGPY